MYEKILIATDGSALSEKAVKHGIELAVIAKSDLTVLTVVPLYPQNYMEGAVVLTIKEIEKIEKQWVDVAQAMVDRACASAAARGVKVKAAISRSDLVGESIISAAKRNHCGLIVMASHGRRGFKRLLMGSETLHVLTHSHIPVLVLRQTENEAKRSGDA